MAQKKSGGNRRKLLKSIIAGSGAVVAGKSLPESWSKPVVSSVILPAHANTTAAAKCQIEFEVPFSATKPGSETEGDYKGSQAAAGPFFGDCPTGFQFAETPLTITLSNVITASADATQALPLASQGFSLISQAHATPPMDYVSGTFKYHLAGEEPLTFPNLPYTYLSEHRYGYETPTFSTNFTTSGGLMAVRWEKFVGVLEYVPENGVSARHDISGYIDVRIEITLKY